MPFYDLTLNGAIHRRLNKRGIILRVVHAAIQAGGHPSQLAPMFDLGDRAWFSADGNLTAAELGERMPAGRRIRFFLEDEQLIHHGGRTYALTNQWGDPSWSDTIRQIAAAFPALGLEVHALDEQAGPAVEFEQEVGVFDAPVAGVVAHPHELELPEINSQLLGAAGEYYVLFQLHRRGLLAGLAPRGYPNVDVIVLGPEQQVAASIQVKTRRFGNHGGWRMDKRHEVPIPGLVFCFVDLEPVRPRTFVVPAHIVAAAVFESHVAWLGIGNHQDHDMRVLSSDWGFPVPGYEPGWLEAYSEAWQALGPG